jgi:hypothetical protein
MHHTPGPWHGGTKRQRDATYAITQGGYRLASVHPRDMSQPPMDPDPEQDANARLIAAAPELLKALSIAPDSAFVATALFPDHSHAH